MKRLLLPFLVTMLFSVVLWGQQVPINWTPSANVTTYQEAIAPYEGNYACKAVIGAAGALWLDNDIMITGLTAGDSCKAKVYTKSSANVRVQIRMIFNDPGATSGFSGFSQGQTNWYPVSKGMVVPAGATGVTLKIRFQTQTGFSPGEEQYVDYMTLESPIGTFLTVANGDFESWPVTAVEPTAGDLIFTEVNSRNPYQARYVEIYNTTSDVLELNKVDLVYNDDGTPNTLSLTGTIDPHSYIVVARHADFSTLYYPGVTPDFVFNGIILNGGVDYMQLVHDDNGVIDQFNDSGSPATWSIIHCFFRFDYSADGSSIADDWDDSGTNLVGTPRAENTSTWNPETGSGNWNTATNWIPEGVPTKGVSVVIVDGTDNPFVGSTSPTAPNECMDLTIQTDGSLTVGPAKFITIHGDVTNNSGSPEGLKIRSTVDGNGSVIIKGSMTGSARVERYVEGYTSAADGWHNLCAPVSMTVAGTGWEPGTVSPDIDDLYYWSESDNLWMNYKTAAFDFVQGNGYLVAYETTQTNSFDGSLTNSNKTHTNLSRVNDGYHMVGNPFPSAIEWNNNSDWVFTNIGSVPSIWDEAGGTYFNPSVGDPIPSTNGFFVQVASGSGGNNTLTIPASARIHSAQNNYKSSATANTEYTLKMKVTTSANTFYNNIRVAFTEDATTGWDMQHDAFKLFGNSAAPELWTIADGKEFAVNTLPFTLDPVHLPLHFRAGANGQYEISFEGVESFMGSSIELEDTFTGLTTNLTQQQAYTFSATTDDDPGRFILHFYGVTAVNEKPLDENISIYTDHNRIYIQFIQGQAKDYVVDIYNLLGQVVAGGKAHSDVTSVLDVSNLHSGIYTVRLTDGERVYSRKIMIGR